MKVKHPKGFSAIEAVLIGVFIVLLVGVGWYVWHQRHKTPTTTTVKTTQSTVKPKTVAPTAAQSDQVLITAAAKTFCNKDDPGQFGVPTGGGTASDTDAVSISKIEGNFASAGVACGSSTEYKFVKISGTWTVVNQGQEAPGCSEVQDLVKYNIPADIMECFDSSGNTVPIR